MRIGTGYDLHRLEPGHKLILGGVTVPHELGTAAHSDGDVLLHAIIDAMLGALALGDIGTHFPDTDAAYRGADSMDLLAATNKLIHGAEFRIVNIDSTVVLQRPKLRPYLLMMRQRIAECLDLHTEAVSVKAKTKEQVGPEGREEAVSAQAVVLLAPHAP